MFLKKKNKGIFIYYFISILLLLIVISLSVFNLHKTFKHKEEKTVQKEKTDYLQLYGYTLDNKDSKLYKETFKELKNILNSKEVNEEKYAKTLSKLFIIDLYTLSTKLTSTDIGGIEFVFPDLLENFKINMGDNMYNHIESNLDGKRKQNLPTVKEVIVDDIEKTTYNYKEEEYEGYKIKLHWEYVNDMGYEDKATLILVSYNNKLYVVEKVKENE